MRLYTMRRLSLLLPVVLIILAACREPPIPTPVPRTPVPLSPRAITPANAGDIVLLASSDDMRSVYAFSPDGRLLAGACLGGLCLRDGHTLALVRRMEIGDWMQCAAFSPDGTLLAVGSREGKVRLWRVSDGQLLATLTGPTLSVEALVFADGGSTVIATDTVPRVSTWRIADDALLRSFSGPTPTSGNPEVRVFPRFADLSPDGALLAVGEANYALRLWRTRNGVLLRTLRSPGPASGFPAFSGDSRFLALAASSTLVLWEFQQGSVVRVWQVDTSSSAAPAFSPDGSLLATGASGGRLRLLRTENGVSVWGFQTMQLKPINNLVFSPDGSLFASSDGQMVCLWGLAP